MFVLLAAAFDLILGGGHIIDGTGRPWFRADVGIKGDRITAIGDLSKEKAARRIDAGGKIIAPGFIDMLGQSELYVLIDNRAESKIRQGITTEITGEGYSAGPTNDALIAEAKPWLDEFKLKVDWRDLDGYFKRFAKTKSAINLGTFVGAASVRAIVLGLGDVQPTPAQLAEMEKLTEKAMQEGALGVSTALIYPPGSYAKTEELIALAKVAAKYHGVYASHIRNEGDTIFDALDEAFRIGKEASLPVEIWHLKAAGKKNWGRMPEIVARIEKARAEGVDVTANMYPYIAAANNLSATIPQWAQAGGADAMLARFHDPEQRKRIKTEVLADVSREGADSLLLASCVNPELKKYMGQRLDAVAKAMNKDAADALIDIVEADRAQTGVVRFLMSEADVLAGLKQPWVSIDCDAAGQATDGPFANEKTHPRAFGTAARLVAKYVRTEHAFSLEEAVRKMTSLPAGRMSLWDRGALRPGFFADVVVFDAEKMRDTATFEEPLRYAEGVDTVIVNGKVVLDAGKMTAERPGRILKHAR